MVHQAPLIQIWALNGLALSPAPHAIHFSLFLHLHSDHHGGLFSCNNQTNNEGNQQQQQHTQRENNNSDAEIDNQEEEVAFTAANLRKQACKNKSLAAFQPNQICPSPQHDLCNDATEPASQCEFSFI